MKTYITLFLFLFSTAFSYAFQRNNRAVQVENTIEISADEEDEISFDDDENTELQYGLEIFDEVDYERLATMLALDNVEMVVPEGFNQRLDYLVNMWMIQQSVKPECVVDLQAVPIVSDSIYKARLARLPHVIEMPFNSHVRSMIELYTSRRPRQVSQLLGMSEYYFPIFEQTLEAYGLPLELRYLPIIESALNNRAVSHMGAAGLWQFMPATGRAYGLEINSLIDERLDPVKSTDAAARYLRDLHRIYGDWNLALAAYNCGPGNVNRAIRRSDGKRDFWEIYPNLPRETRGYLPIFIAANYAMNYAKEHNICPTTIDRPISIDTVMITERVHLEQIASVLNVPIELIRTLNPQYRRDIIPGDLKPYSLRLPLQYTTAFVDQRDSVLAYRADELIHNRRAEVEAHHGVAASGGTGNFVTHTVRSGETLSHIAARYGTTVANLRRWNNISGSRINIGQRIRIYR